MKVYSKSVVHKWKSTAVSILVLVGAIFHSFSSWGQSAIAPMMKITLNDKVLEQTLEEYTKETKAKVIAILIERYDNDYTYTLRDFGLFDSVKKNPTTVYGEWQNCILLFYSGVELIVSPIDSVAVNKVQRHLRPILPNQFSEEKVYKNGMVEDSFITFDPIIWRFKVRDGKLMWLRRGLAYQSEKIPYLK